MIVTQTPRGDEMFLQMIAGATQHMLDHEVMGRADLKGMARGANTPDYRDRSDRY